MPKNLGVHTFPDPVGHFGAPWRPFWILQAVWRCRRCGVAGGERVPPSPLFIKFSYMPPPSCFGLSLLAPACMQPSDCIQTLPDIPCFLAMVTYCGQVFQWWWSLQCFQCIQMALNCFEMRLVWIRGSLEIILIFWFSFARHALAVRPIIIIMGKSFLLGQAVQWRETRTVYQGGMDAKFGHLA